MERLRSSFVESKLSGPVPEAQSPEAGVGGNNTTPALSSSVLAYVDCIFSGSVERIAYFNEETGQCVVDIRTDKHKGHLLIAGSLASIYPGQGLIVHVSLTVAQKQEFEAAGTLSTEGLLKARQLTVAPPPQGRALKKFLKSEAMPGIGPKLATLLSQAFPTSLFSVLDETPEQLLKIHGVGLKKQKQILSSWTEFKALTRFEEFLFAEKLPLNWAKLLWRTHRFESFRVLTEEPYSVVRSHDFSFDIIDAFALRRGFALDSTERIQCALYDLLQGYYRQGHCAYPEKELMERALEKTGVSAEIVEDVLELELVDENLISEIIAGTPCLYAKEIWKLERDVARQLLAFELRETPWGWIHLEKLLSWAQDLLEIQLAPLQKQAIETALSSALTVITGGPGTGKTTLIRSLVTILQTQFCRFALCSPTGRAAQRLEESTGAPAHTIHRLLKYNGMTGTFGYNRERLLDIDLVLIDEVSMVDLSLMSHLLDALPPHCALILVGDADQIPSVGAGSVLQSVIASGRFSTVRLTDIFRQSEQSLIKINSNRINAGQMPLTAYNAKNDFHYIPVRGLEETKKTILDLFTRVIPKECGITDPREFQILVPMNRGALGTRQLNDEIQEFIAKKTLGDDLYGELESVSGFGQNFKRGDKVMAIKNDYVKDVFNGDIGFIRNIDHEQQGIDVQFGDRLLRFGFAELDRLTLAYAISIHKSQGSEYRAVIVVVTGEHLPMVHRHLIYTAVTRGKEHVFLVAEPSALQAAILSDENNRRWQKLTELLTVTAISGDSEAQVLPSPSGFPHLRQ
jgi:exodeoxyribonuclease V alpha subunit